MTAPLFLGQLVPVVLLVAFVVAAATVGQALEQHRAAALPSFRQKTGERFVHGRHVAALDGRAFETRTGATASLTRSTWVWAERGVNSAKPLFSQTRITGSSHSAARLTDSQKCPA